MKKMIVSALSAAALLAPVSAMACMLDHSTEDWSLEPGVTNVSAYDKMDMRVDTVVNGRMRMNDEVMTRPLSQTGRPDRRGVQKDAKVTYKSKSWWKHTSIKGYDRVRESASEAK